MARVNITVPDDVVAQAKDARLNVSRLATAALVEELDRRSKIDALDAYLAGLDREFGPITAGERSAAAAWVDDIVAPPTARRPASRKRSA